MEGPSLCPDRDGNGDPLLTFFDEIGVDTERPLPVGVWPALKFVRETQ